MLDSLTRTLLVAALRKHPDLLAAMAEVESGRVEPQWTWDANTKPRVDWNEEEAA